MKRSLLLIAVLGTLATPAAADSKLQPIPHSAAVVLSPGANTIGRATYDSTARPNGCDADVKPVTVTAYCWDEDANPSDYAVGASTGGSD